MFLCIEIGNVVSFILPLKRLTKGLSMTTVKFEEGTKKETSLELEDGEVIIWVKSPKNAMATTVEDGCLMGFLTLITLGIILIFKPPKHWMTNLVITNKRVVSIPLPPNKKNYPAESYYYNKDFGSVKAITVGSKQSDRMANAAMNIFFGPNSSYKKPRKIGMQMELSAKNVLKVLGQMGKEGLNDLGNSLGQYNAQLQSYHNKLEAESSGAMYYKEITHKAEKLAQSDTSIEGLRDAIIDIIDDCIEASKKAGNP